MAKWKPRGMPFAKGKDARRNQKGRKKGSHNRKHDKEDARRDWIIWLDGFGGGKFYDAFLALAQDAQGFCTQCHQDIYIDIVEGGGVPDWRTDDGDYGCPDSPETTEDGTGSHVVRKKR